MNDKDRDQFLKERDFFVHAPLGVDDTGGTGRKIYTDLGIVLKMIRKRKPLVAIVAVAECSDSPTRYLELLEWAAAFVAGVGDIEMLEKLVLSKPQLELQHALVYTLTFGDSGKRAFEWLITQRGMNINTVLEVGEATCLTVLAEQLQQRFAARHNRGARGIGNFEDKETMDLIQWCRSKGALLNDRCLRIYCENPVAAELFALCVRDGANVDIPMQCNRFSAIQCISAGGCKSMTWADAVDDDWIVFAALLLARGANARDRCGVAATDFETFIEVSRLVKLSRTHRFERTPPLFEQIAAAQKADNAPLAALLMAYRAASSVQIELFADDVINIHVGMRELDLPQPVINEIIERALPRTIARFAEPWMLARIELIVRRTPMQPPPE